MFYRTAQHTLLHSVYSIVCIPHLFLLLFRRRLVLYYFFSSKNTSYLPFEIRLYVLSSIPGRLPLTFSAFILIMGTSGAAGLPSVCRHFFSPAIVGKYHDTFNRLIFAKCHEDAMSKSSAKELTQHTSLTSPFRYYPSALPDLNFFFPPHWHNEFELNYIRTGRAVFLLQRRAIHPGRGRYLYFSAKSDA